MTLKRIDNGFETLRIFLDRALGIDSSQKNLVSGRQLTAALTSAASHNTYVETVSDKADTLNRHIKSGLTSMMMYAYLEQVRRLASIKKWNEKPVILAFDYTEEDFYGDVQGFDIHGWTGKQGVEGKFKLLTCSIVNDEIPEKIPFFDARQTTYLFKICIHHHACQTRFDMAIERICLITNGLDIGVM